MTGSGTARWRVERVCATGADLRTLRLRRLAELRRSVGFDAYAWVVTDPETRAGSAPLADVPCLHELPRLVGLRYLTPLNRWTAMTRRPVALLAEASGGDPGRSLLWRELLSRYDVSDVATVVFEDGFGCWAFLGLWRTGGRTFDRKDAEFLREIAPTVTPPFDAARTDLRGRVTLRAPDRAPGPAARAGAEGGAADTRDAAGAAAACPPRRRRVSPTERLSLFARCAGLSARETELLDLLATGADTREVAARMFVSAHTVQDHLKSVFDKPGTCGRRALLARALGG